MPTATESEITHDTPAPSTFPFPVILTPTQVTVYVNNRPASIDRSTSTWHELVELIKTGGSEVTAEQVLALVSPARYLQAELANTEVTVRDGAVWWGDEQVHESLASIILGLVAEGLDPQSFLNFATKVYANPSEYARAELYEWLTKAKLPIAPDGDFYAYKYVSRDYKDCYSGKFDNSVGQVVEMDRDKVDPNRRNYCSTGLHFASLDYIRGNGSGYRYMLVKINPADVVSIPSDYNFTKGRTCRYEVVEELEGPDVLAQTDWSTVVEVKVEKVDAPERQPRKAKKASKRDGSTAKKAAKAVAKKKAAAPAKKAAAPAKPKAGQVLTVVESSVAGRITKTRYRDLKKEHGTDAAIAKHFGISSGTVRAWKSKLGL